MPVLLSSPHSGTGLPYDFNYSCDPALLHKANDLYVDFLFAPLIEEGFTMVQARCSRTYIDVNRTIASLPPYLGRSFDKASQEGWGLIWTQVAKEQGLLDLVDIYTKASQPDEADIIKRIREYWVPYHITLRKELQSLKDRFGYAILIDCHSSPGEKIKGDLGSCGLKSDIEVSNCNGLSSRPEILAFLGDRFRAHGMDVGINELYLGGHVLKQHSLTDRDVQGLQIEINRDLYLTEDGKALHMANTQKMRSILSETLTAMAQEFSQPKEEFSPVLPEELRQPVAR